MNENELNELNELNESKEILNTTKNSKNFQHNEKNNEQYLIIEDNINNLIDIAKKVEKNSGYVIKNSNGRIFSANATKKLTNHTQEKTDQMNTKNQSESAITTNTKNNMINNTTDNIATNIENNIENNTEISTKAKTENNNESVNLSTEKNKKKKYNGFLRNNNHSPKEKHIDSNKNKQTVIVNETNEISTKHIHKSSVNKTNHNKTKINPNNSSNNSSNSQKVNNPNQFKKNSYVKNYKNTTPFNSIPDFDEDNYTENTNSENLNTETKEEYAVFSFLKQKTGYDENKFWENLSVILKTKKFSDIKRSEFTLISYATLHDNSTIFLKLLHTFGLEVSNQEYIQQVFKYGIHKKSEIIGAALEFYGEHFKVENDFLVSFIKDISSSSYRQENNKLFLNWITVHLTDEHLKLFWDNSLSSKNIPIMSEALKKYEFAHYLKNHYEQYEPIIKKLGQEFEFKKSLQYVDKLLTEQNKNNSQEHNNSLTNHSVTMQDFEPKIWLSDKNEQFKMIQENLSEKKPTEVIVKKRRKIG